MPRSSTIFISIHHTSLHVSCVTRCTCIFYIITGLKSDSCWILNIILLMYVSQARGGFNRQIRCFTRVDNQSLHPFSHLSVYYSIEPSKSKINLKNSKRVTWKCVQSLNVHAMKIFLILHCVQKPIRWTYSRIYDSNIYSDIIWKFSEDTLT